MFKLKELTFYVDKHPTARMFFSTFVHCALARHSCLISASRSTLSVGQLSFSSEISDRKVIGHSCSTLPLEQPLGAASTLSNSTNTLTSRSSL